MCGIAGLTTFNQATTTQNVLQEMGDVISHRGPDASGTYIDDEIGLVHRRLAIIDLSDAGVQPMHSFDERYVIAFNGEIYNFLEHRKLLESEGYAFKTHSDTEVILALYAKYGVDCLSRLNGMFAFALWDKQEKELFIARDRMGKKPLYYHESNGDIYFASELKSLLAINAFPKNVRTDAVYDFFAYQYVPDPKTIFEDVYKLEPGHYMLVKNSNIEVKKYWDISFANVESKTEQEFVEDLDELLTQCTKNRMVSDVPLGAFLSGGVDSSGVVALMAKIANDNSNERHSGEGRNLEQNHQTNSSSPNGVIGDLQQNSSDSKITTCSIGFDDKKFNETEFAQIVAEQYQTNHHEFTVHQNVKDNLEHIVKFFDEPFADPSLVPTYFVSELAKQKVTVAVAGDGGDEVFAGYEKYSIDYLENKLRDKCPSWLRKGVFPSLAKLAGKVNATPFKKAKSLLNTLSVDPAMGFYISNSFITDEQWNGLVKDDVAKQLNGYHPSTLTTKRYQEANGTDHIAKILYTDMKTYLPGGILVKVDRMSMAHSLEVRAPILDYQVVEKAAAMPSNIKFKVSADNTKGEKKHILKELFKPMLPNDILYRKKMGFSVPLADWLRGELKEIAEQKLLHQQSGLVNYFNQGAIKDMWEAHSYGGKDFSSPLWSMLMFQMWWDEYMDVTNG